MNPQTASPFSSQLEGFLVDLSDRAKFRLSGEDRIRYLNGQVTNDVRKATKEKSLHACVTNLKGRIEADVRIHSAQNGQAELWLDAEPGLRDSLALRLERYIIADDVELHDVTDQWKLFHLCGSLAEPFLSQAGNHGMLLSHRYGLAGVDVWFPSDQPELAQEWLTKTGVLPLESSQLNQWRILKGIPRWPEELNDGVFPQEAGLENTAMDFHKGCYIGQEILSRIKTSGKTPYHLVRVKFAPSDLGNHSVESLSKAEIMADENGDSKRPVGHLTSVARHPELDQFIGLAYVRHSQPFSHSLLLVIEPTSKIAIPIQVEPLLPQ